MKFLIPFKKLRCLRFERMFPWYRFKICKLFFKAVKLFPIKSINYEYYLGKIKISQQYIRPKELKIIKDILKKTFFIPKRIYLRSLQQKYLDP